MQQVVAMRHGVHGDSRRFANQERMKVGQSFIVGLVADGVGLIASFELSKSFQEVSEKI